MSAPASSPAALARRDLSFRNRMVQYMLLCALLRHPIPEDVAENVASFARELGVEDGMVRVAGEFAHGSLGLAAVDFVRNGYEGTWNEEASSAAVHSSRVLHDAWEFSVADPELAAQWAALEHLPPDSIGRGVWEMYQSRGFTFPGTPGSAPPLLAQHDWVHVLGDYGTTVESEVEVFGLIAAGERRHARLLAAGHGDLAVRDRLPGQGGGAVRILAGPLLLRRTDGGAAVRRDARAAPAATTTSPGPTASTSCRWTGSRWRTSRARRCGHASTSCPNREAALAAGSVGPWERGGISPFQMNAGRALAASQDRPYEAHGASLAD